MMVNGSIEGSSLLPLALLPLFLNPNADWSLSVPDTTILMWGIWISLLVVISRSVGLLCPHLC